MSDAASAKQQLRGGATSAKRDLAWLAAIHVALKSTQQDVLRAAKILLVNPEGSLTIQNLPPAEAKKVRARAVQAFRAFCDCATEFPGQSDPAGPGHFLNQSAILRADAILQAFLDRCYEAIAAYKRLQNRNPKTASVSGKLKEFKQECFLGNKTLDTENHVKFVAQLRHVITHNHGFVDEEFLKNCGMVRDPRSGKFVCSGSPLWDQNIWPDEQAFLADYRPPQNGQKFQATVKIEKVIIPHLKHCFDFVDEFVDALISYNNL